MLRHLKRRAQRSFKKLEEQQTLLTEDNKTIQTLEYGKILEAEHGRNEFLIQEGETVPVKKTDNIANTPASPALVRSCKEVSSSWSFHPELEPRLTVAHAESVTPVTPVTRSVEVATEGVSFPQIPSGTDDYNTANYKNRKGYIKKPMNAYMVWVRTQWSSLCKANPNASFAEIGMLLGIRWKNLSEEQKKPYYAEARRLKQKHRKKFPDCVYNAETRKRGSPEVAPLDATSNTSPTVPLAHPQRSAPQNIPVASPRNSSLQYSARQTNPMFSVMDMPREVPPHGLVSGSCGQFPGLSRSQVPLSPGGVLVAPSCFPFVPPFYMPRLPFCHTRIMASIESLGHKHTATTPRTAQTSFNVSEVEDSDRENAEKDEEIDEVSEGHNKLNEPKGRRDEDYPCDREDDGNSTGDKDEDDNAYNDDACSGHNKQNGTEERNDEDEGSKG